MGNKWITTKDGKRIKIQMPYNNCWISVKDRLPEQYKEVLVYTEKYGTQVDWIADTPYYWHNYGELVTHWQPKPEPPKGRKENKYG